METLRGVWKVLKILGWIILALVIITIGLALFNRPTIAVAAASVVLMLGELLVILGAFTLGCLYARGLMVSGAEIGIRAQESDDQRDVEMIKSVTNLADTIIRATRNNESPPPPMPQQNWLPPTLEVPRLTDGSDGDEFKIN